jgi:hypothetical protein
VKKFQYSITFTQLIQIIRNQADAPLFIESFQKIQKVQYKVAQFGKFQCDKQNKQSSLVDRWAKEEELPTSK